MFGWFKSPAFHDDVLGEFTRARGHWRGQIALGGAAGVPLVLSGPKAAPDAPALAAARTLGGEFDSMRPPIECALFEHQAPYS